MYRDPSTWQSSFRPPPVTCQAWMTGLLVLWHLPKTLLGSACSNNQSLNSLLMLTAATLSLLRLGVTSSAAATAWELLDLPWQINRSVYTAGGSLSLSVGLGSLPSVGWWLWGSLFFTNLSEITIIGLFGIIARNTCGRPNFVWKVLSQTCECVGRKIFVNTFLTFQAPLFLCLKSLSPCLAASSSRCRSFWTFSWRACACSTCHCLQQIVRSVQWKKPLG